jgi:hypothetical protein
MKEVLVQNVPIEVVSHWNPSTGLPLASLMFKLWRTKKREIQNTPC